MGFREQTSAFFDELTQIVDDQLKAREQGPEGESPFSSMLTQDEEPVTPEPGVVEQEPEILTRHGV